MNRLVVGALALLLPVTSSAGESSFAGTEEAAEAEKPETSLSAELGGTYTTGNAVYFSIAGGINGYHKWKQNQFGWKASTLLSQGIADADGSGSLDDDERDTGLTWTSQRVDGEVRYDRFFGTKNSLYLLVGGERSPFAGFDFRFHYQLGYSRIIVATEKTDLKAEIGLDYAQENWVDTAPVLDAQYIAGRLLLGFGYKFNDNVAFTDQIEMFENFFTPVDFRLYNTATLSARLSQIFSVKLSHRLAFDNQPVEGFRPLDQTTMMTLVASIF